MENSEMRINRLDHLVLTVLDIDATVAFYAGVLGMTDSVFGDGRRALNFGTSKINLHQASREFEPKASHPQPGSADVCLIVDDPIDEVVDAPGVRGHSCRGGTCRSDGGDRHDPQCLRTRPGPEPHRTLQVPV